MYKRLLIIGETISNKDGPGITLSNLFTGWPKERLFLANHHKKLNNSNYNICENYYSLGKDERKIRFPLRLIKKQYESGPVSYDGKDNLQKDKNNSSKKNIKILFLKSYLTRFVEKGLFYLGLYYYCIQLKPSAKFKKWINEINPDIIYCQLPSLEVISFVYELSKIYQFKLVIHVMDDQPRTLNKSVMFKKHWDHVIADKIISLINKANLLLSISEGMSIEYRKRYGKDFIPFHNPIDLKKWLPYKKHNWDVKGKFTLLYLGRIGVATYQSLLKICYVLDLINNGQSLFKIDIFSPDYESIYSSSLLKYSCVNIKGPIDHKEVPVLLSSYDLLVLPLDFNPGSIKFARLSMPTKASEYMISGTPIIIFASEETEIVRHAKKYKWAYCVTEYDNNILKNAILELYGNINLRKMYSMNAHEYASNNYDAEKVRNRFNELICNA